MNVSLSVWLLTVAGLCVLVAADFFIGRKPHDVSLREAGIWTAVWVVLACLFGVGLLVVGGGGPGAKPSPVTSPRSRSASTTSSSSC
ncbi:hypothetical protein STENM36S_04376 [Streptomyces tendae]